MRFVDKAVARSIARPPSWTHRRTVLSADALKEDLRTSRRAVRAVNNASLRVPRGAIVGLVGESGSGQEHAAAVASPVWKRPDQGTTTYLGRRNSGDSWRATKHPDDVQMVFQDPESTLNPALTGATTCVALMSLRRWMPARRSAAWTTPWSKCGCLSSISTASTGAFRRREAADRDRPAFLSARSCAVRRARFRRSTYPCNRPSAILLDLQHEGELPKVFVSHDLAIVRYMADRIAVMYLGK